jgi:IclR family transcriptional regulator, acetate operon repressor
MRNQKSNGRAGSVQSLTRALSIIKFIASHSGGATLSDIARYTLLPVSTTHRLLTTLQQDRFVHFDPQGARWTIAVGAFVVGSAYLQARDLARTARPFLRRLMEASGETANFAILDEDMAVYLGQVESRQTMRAICTVGGRVFLHSSALGKSMLALMYPEEVSRVLSVKGMRRLTGRTMSTRSRIAIELRRARKAGFAIDDEEYCPGLRCVAAAVTDEHGQPLGAISISGPSIRITRDRLQELGKLVSSVADELTGELGGKRDALDPDLSTAISPKISTLRKVRTSKKRHLMQQSFR